MTGNNGDRFTEGDIEVKASDLIFTVGLRIFLQPKRIHRTEEFHFLWLWASVWVGVGGCLHKNQSDEACAIPKESLADKNENRGRKIRFEFTPWPW